MGKKTIIFTERQLNEITGGDFSYLDGMNDGKFPGNNEVTVGQNTSVSGPAPTIGNKVSKQMGSSDNWYTMSRGRILGVPLMCSKKAFDRMMLSESNSELEGDFFTFDPTTLRKLNMTRDSSTRGKGSIALNNLIEKGGMSYTEATTLKNRMEHMDHNSDEYFNLGGDALYEFINNTLQAKTSAITNRKKVRTAAGMTNQYQKAGGSKDVGNGKAHTTPKITYF